MFPMQFNNLLQSLPEWVVLFAGTGSDRFIRIGQSSVYPFTVRGQSSKPMASRVGS